ncbi:MAG: hypothetical protein ABJF86_14665 [Tateyamaria sp.]|uniref:hypothetical protein n=1 Tax=Tateyamaria sp. TaxID=1929288 RepID=UPI0032765C28
MRAIRYLAYFLFTILAMKAGVAAMGDNRGFLRDILLLGVLFLAVPISKAIENEYFRRSGK